MTDALPGLVAFAGVVKILRRAPMTSVEVARRVAAYLQGVGLDRGGRRPGKSLELPSLTGAGTVAYYADSTGIRPGYWPGGRGGPRARPRTPRALTMPCS